MKLYGRKIIIRVGLMLVLLVCALGAAGVTPVYAATLTVTNANDDGAGSLRQAIATAADGDTITFDADYEIHVLSTLTIGKTVTIDGSGHTVTISGDNARRVFEIQSTGMVTLRHLSITNGLTVNSGGGISNAGWLAVVDCTMTGNSAWIGGAIYNTGTLSVEDSTLSGNTTSKGGVGGAICNNSGGTATIENSILTGNSADDGGAVYNNTTTSASHLTITGSTVSGNSAVGDYGAGGGLTNTGKMTIRASTISGNTTTYQGGGVANMDDTLTIENSTVTGNTAASQGGGVFNSSGVTVNISNSTVTENRANYRGGGVDNHGTMNLVNTIVANSLAGGDCRNSVTLTADHTLIESSGTTGCDLTNGVNGNIIGSDPLLGSLGNYGGGTQTYTLLPGSPAIDAGQNCLATDQRGMARPQPAGGACDIGAFESQGFTLAVSGGNGQSTMVTTAFADPLSVTVTANNPVEPVNGGMVTFTTPVSGASAVITGSPATISGGAGSVTATANGTAGSYTVSASMKGAPANADFGLTNTCNMSITVTNANDDGAGSLREAITRVCSGGTITFDADYEIHVLSTLTIGKTVTIDGSGHTVTISGDNARRVFEIQSTGVVTLRHLSITNGLTVNNGGGISNAGWLSVVDCTMTGNKAWVGGAIYNTGTLSVEDSTLSGNTTSKGGVGGAICNNSGGTATIENSILTGNSADDGGAVYNNTTTSASHLTITGSTVSGNSAVGDYGAGGGLTNTGKMTIRASTISGNTTTYQGGGVANMDDTLTIENSTVTGNTAASQGGGVFNSSGVTVNISNSTVTENRANYRGGGVDNHGTMNLVNTIVANSLAGGDCRNSVTLTADHTLIESSGTTGCDLTNGVNGNIIGSDPLLGSLGNYGGGTQTYTLLPGSPAIDAGQNCLTTDQRGMARPQPAGGACDIGAFEANGDRTVTFNANGGSGSMANQVSSIPDALTANSFTRTGFIFSGWNSAADGSGTAYADGAVYDFTLGDITLYAQWTIQNHTVTFNANGGTGSMANQVNNIPAALTANTFTRDGYTFSGWNSVADGTGTAYAGGATYDFTLGDITLYAQWAVDNHTVTFNANSGTGSMANQVTNLPAALTANTFTRTGYTFSGWNTAADGSGTAYTDGATYNFSADVTLYARWTAANHTVTFNANGGTGSMANQVTNLPAALTANAFTRTGFTFSGWNSAANGSGTAFAGGATYDFTLGDITLYAQWTIVNHTVTFNANLGSGTMAPQVSNLPVALTANAFTRTGYYFSGWNSAADGSGTAYADGATYDFTLGNITLYARWEVVPPAAFGKFSPVDIATGISNTPTLSWSASSSQTDYEYCYDTAASGACAGTWTSTSNTTNSALSGLSYNTTYRWQARAVNLGVYTYADGGVMWAFTTTTQAPTVVTDPATSVTTDSATLNGTVNAWNDSMVVTFEYGTTTAYGTTVTATGSPVTGSANTAVTYSLSGLLPNTTYHYRVMGQNSAGTSYGGDRTFTTNALSVVITSEIHNAAHGIVTSASLSDSLHTSATVTGNGTMAATGTVTFTAFDNPACSGTGTNAGTVSLAGGVAEPSLSETLTANGLSFRARYDGDINYPAADGDCISISTSAYPTVLTLSAHALPRDGATLTASPSNLLIQFSQDMLHGAAADPNSAENPTNYLLVSQGVNGTFDTVSCGPAGIGGLQPDDTRITVNTASYDSATYIARLTVNGGARLPNGIYRLFVCGTTSITDPSGTIYLNNHTADSVTTFTLAVPNSSGSGSGGEESGSKTLPATGFMPDAVTILPMQPAGKAYTDEDMWLEIPAMGLRQPVVGVPGPDWDVTWLDDQIGYLQGTAFPTWDGNSVLTGHVTNANGKAGPFAGLGTLTWGDRIVVHAWGQEYIYEARSVDLWTDPNSTGILTRHETLPWLTLITCRGYDEETNTYRWRTVVRAVLVEIR